MLFIQRTLLIIISCLMLAGCLQPYRPPIQQGNELNAQTISQLHLGMSKDDVQYLLGTPILNNDIGSNEWDYVYTLEPKNSTKITKKHLSLFFNNQDKLVSIQNNYTLPSPQ